MKSLYKILFVCLFVGACFSRASNNYQKPIFIDIGLSGATQQKSISEQEDDDSLKWKRRHKRRKKTRRKKRGM